MTVTRFRIAAVLVLAVAQTAAAQNPPLAARLEIQPASLSLDVGGTVQVSVAAFDSAGRRITVPLAFFTSSRRALSVDSTGTLRANRPGTYRLTAAAFGEGQSARAQAEVTVNWPPVRTVDVLDAPTRYYAGVSSRHRARVVDASGAERTNVDVTWESSNPAVARVNAYGDVEAVRVGQATLRASAGGVTGTHRIAVVANPVRSIELSAGAESGRTGDVIRFTAVARDARGRDVPVPITFTVRSNVEDTVIAPGAAAVIASDGRFVAQRAGDFTILASAGNVTARHTVGITHRPPSRRIATGTGQGAVRDVHTSDLWIWTGRDGRDYAVTGTWGANGVAYFWDVTDPAAPTLTDSIQVDARTVNDVKVDPERGICVITREGASNRRNGFVVLDCSNPRDVQVLSRFDDGLLGGVHNVYLYNQHVFAINAGRRFDIISIQDPRNPRRVGFFELDTPGHGIHDVWVADGIAYCSQWGDGVVLVDVGNGIAGGTLEQPRFVNNYRYPIGATHAAFPYRSRSTGRQYVFIGDEQFPYGLNPDQPTEAGGYIHIVDFTDVRNPQEVARYQVPEAGTHNLWVENDTLYVAYYNAGLRVVDVSGELMGDLYEQGRELARFEARDPQGKVANTPMAWGPQPHRGHIFFSDFNSGLWSVRLPMPERPVVP